MATPYRGLLRNSAYVLRSLARTPSGEDDSRASPNVRRDGLRRPNSEHESKSWNPLTFKYRDDPKAYGPGDPASHPARFKYRNKPK